MIQEIYKNYELTEMDDGTIRVQEKETSTTNMYCDSIEEAKKEINIHIIDEVIKEYKEILYKIEQNYMYEKDEYKKRKLKSQMYNIIQITVKLHNTIKIMKQ